MKNFLMSLVLLVCTSVVVNAQDYKPFKLGLGLGYTMPDGGGGILFDIEPAYRLNDAIALGFRWESAAMAKKIGDDEAEISGHSSYSLNAQYYLSSSTVRPYIGLGFGLFQAASGLEGKYDASTGTVEYTTDKESKFGFYPRIGLDIGHFNINLDYNIISTTEAEEIEEDGLVIESPEIKNSYLGIRVGAFIFGGRN